MLAPRPLSNLYLYCNTVKIIYRALCPGMVWKPVRKLDLDLLDNKAVRCKANRYMQCSALHRRFNAGDCCFIIQPFGQSLFLHIFSFFVITDTTVSLFPQALICRKISVCKLRSQFSDRLLDYMIIDFRNYLN